MKNKKLSKVIIVIMTILLTFGCRKGAWQNVIEGLSDEERSFVNNTQCIYESTNYSGGTIYLKFYIKDEMLHLTTSLNNVDPSDLNIIADTRDINLTQSITLEVNNAFLEAFGNYFLSNKSCMTISASEKKDKITLATSGSINFKLTDSTLTPADTTPTSSQSKTFFNSALGTKDTITFSVIKDNYYVKVNDGSSTKFIGEDLTLTSNGQSYFVSASEIEKIITSGKVNSNFYLSYDEENHRFKISTDSTGSYSVLSESSGSSSNSPGGSEGGDSESNNECSGLFGNGYFPKILKKAFEIIRIIGIGLVLVLSIVDFAGGIVAQNEDKIKQASTKSVKRLIFAIIIFLLPTILNILLSIVDGMGNVCV